MDWVANGLNLLALAFTSNGKPHIGFPIGVICSLLFMLWGFMSKNYSFIFANFIYLSLNIRGSYYWIRKYNG